MKAKYPGKCLICAQRFEAGDEISRAGLKGWAHSFCTVAAGGPTCNICKAALALGFTARGLCFMHEPAVDGKYRDTEVWNPDLVRWALEVDNLFVERALDALFDRQMSDEQTEEQTKHLNGIGFSAADAKRLSLSAKWVRSGRRLDGWYLSEVRRRLVKYSRQLAVIVNQRKAEKARRLVGKDSTGEPALVVIRPERFSEVQL